MLVAAWNRFVMVFVLEVANLIDGHVRRGSHPEAEFKLRQICDSVDYP